MSFFKKVTKIITAPLCAVLAFALFSCSNSSNSSNSDIEQKTSGWLFLVYLDADDTGINDSMYQNMRMAEYSLAKMRNQDGSPKEGYPTINIVVLWDGVSEEKKGKSKILHPDGAVFEIGADYELQERLDKITTDAEAEAAFQKWEIGPNTKDLTDAARGWLKKEPDMGDYKTLEGFLKWAKPRYKSENLVLCLNDHGAGTHKETYTDSTAISKSLCSDATNASKKLLTCAGIKSALKAAGYTGSDKPKILCNDVCLQATAEILYNYAGCADYMTASPNISVLNDWSKVYTCIKNGFTALDVGKLIVSAYYNTYHGVGANFHQPEAEAKGLRASGYSMFTFSFMSLDQKKAADLKAAVDKFADALLAIYDGEASHDTFNSIYTKYIKQDMNDLSECKGLAYAGTFAYLNDLGWLAKEVLADNNLSAAHAAAQELLDLLKHGDDKLIVYAWGGNRASGENASGWTGVTANSMYLTGQKDFASGNAVAVEHDDDVYGLTIVGSSRCYYPQGSSTPALYPDTDNPVKNYYDWTEFSYTWGTVINNWMKWAYNL